MTAATRSGRQGPTTRSERADATAVLIVGTLVLAAAVAVVVLRATQTFRPDGIAWVLPIDQQPIDATVGSGSSAVHGYATQALVIVPGLSPVGTGAIVLSHVVWAAAAVLVIGSSLFIAWSFLRGRFFAPGTVRALAMISWALAIGAGAVHLLDGFGRNSIVAALNPDRGPVYDTPDTWSWLPVFAVGVALGLITTAFRRGMRLQKETEGLV